jgi:arginyl-tRNA--protein-N-Asp/Glu arginylyltransferase
MIGVSDCAMQTSSHYPALPVPARVRLHVFPEHDCAYLPGRLTRLRAFFAQRVDPDVYHDLMDAGFRRSGRMVYQPMCRGCRACAPIRVPVARFRPSKSQRRCARRNADVHVTVGAPAPSGEKFELYRRYATQWHGSADPGSRGEFETFLYDSPVDTIELTYRAGGPGGALLAVGICDVCAPRSLSSVYFWFDPRESRRGLGTFGALVEIERARALGVEHYYLGYWVRECAAMSYKSSFRPHQLLDTDGVWREIPPPS